jgi:threonine synthase
MRTLAEKTGIFGEPAGLAGMPGLKKASAARIVKADQSAAVVITGNGLKDVKNARRAASDPIEVEPDLAKLTKIFAEQGVTSDE